MASDVMSLFGMDPNVIQQNRVQSGVDNASRMSADFAIGAAGGQLAGAGINSAFGLQTPDMAQAASVQSGLQGQDLTTAAGLRAAAQKLMMNGDYAQAMALHAQARDMEAANTTATNLEQDRQLGKTSNIVVQAAVVDPMGGLGGSPAISHTVRQNYDGTVDDATMGSSHASYADWMAAVRTKYNKGTTATSSAKPNAQEVLQAVKDGTPLPDGSSVSATDLTLGPKPQELIDAETLNAQLASEDVEQTEHEDNITLYDSMLPSIKSSPAGLELKAKIDAFEKTLVSPMSDAEFEAERLAEKKAKQYKKDLGDLQNNIDALKATYAAMPEISKNSNQGLLINTMLLDALQEKDLFLQSNPQG